MDYYTVKLAGWSKDGRYVVMSDHFDLWALPRRPDDAAMPIRLTPDGRERRISYTWLDLEGKVRWFRNLVRPAPEDAQRSEEHTSELQSLMRISYAVFCLKKKKTTPKNMMKN